MMQELFQSSENIGDIVSRFPKASEIFKEYNIDFCCGGNRPLSQALKEKNLSEKEVMDKINNEYEHTMNRSDEQVDWRNASYSELIDYVVNTHHSYLQRELPELSELITKILRVHGANHSELLTKVHRLFHSLKVELEQHLVKEEQILFPLIKKYEISPSAVQLNKIIEVMRETESEHDNAGDILKELRKITGQYAAPWDACTTFCLTYDKLVALESDLFQHIHLENNILFARIERQMQKGHTSQGSMHH